MTLTKRLSLVQLPISVAPKRLTFYAIFYAVFCLSGILTIASGFVYRAALVSLLALPLVFFYGIRWTNVTLAYSGLVTVILISALLNNSSPLQILLFLRIVIFSYLIYYITSQFITSRTVYQVLRRCILIACIQLPVMLFQFSAYDYLPSSWTASAIRIDYGFGTFNYKTDYALAFFLTLLVTFLLFDERRAQVVTRYRWWIIAWLSLTVMLTNSQMTKFALVMVWFVYFLTHVKLKNILLAFVATVIVLVTVVVGESTGIFAESPFGFVDRMQQVISQIETANPEERFLVGQYDRAAAIRFYIEQGVNWFGDGPSAYSNPLSGEQIRGNFGHVFVFYSEVGLLGWLLSVLIFFFIAFPITNGKIRIGWISALMFLSANILSFTSNVMNDVGVMLSYCIIARYYLVHVEVPKTSIRNT